jgi:hypothetical protein
MDLLLERGARLDLAQPDALDPPLTEHAPLAAEKMLALGAPLDVVSAAGLGRMAFLREAFDERGRLRARPRRKGATLTERDAIGLAMLFAYVRQQREAVEFLLEKDGNWNMIGVNNGTALHRAAWAGDLAMIQRLVARGADVNDRRNPFHATPLSWASHNHQEAVVRWMGAHAAVDLHDAVCFDLRDALQARLREDPASVNRRVDQWHVPQDTALHWAAALGREEAARLLLESGADPNLPGGNGLTPLDLARRKGATGVASLLERYGARPASGA